MKKIAEYAIGAIVALILSWLLFGCLDIPETDEIVDKCEAAANRARAEATAECTKLVKEQVEAGREWLEQLAQALGCVQVIDPVDGPTSEWDCTAVCEKAPDSVIIP